MRGGAASDRLITTAAETIVLASGRWCTRRGVQMTANTKFEPFNVNVRIKLSALDGEAVRLRLRRHPQPLPARPPSRRGGCEIGAFTVNQSFVLGTTVYGVIPSLMVFGALLLPPRVNRIANIVLGIMYPLTIIVGALGEWITTSPAAPSRLRCWRPLSTTRGPGRNYVAPPTSAGR